MPACRFRPSAHSDSASSVRAAAGPSTARSFTPRVRTAPSSGVSAASAVRRQVSERKVGPAGSAAQPSTSRGKVAVVVVDTVGFVVEDGYRRCGRPATPRMASVVPSSPVLAAAVAERIHRLRDERADFAAAETDAALEHVVRVLIDLTGAHRAFWLGAVRLAADGDPLEGWRMRGRRLNPTPEDDQVYKLSQRRLAGGTADAVTLAQVRQAGVSRARLLRELAPPGVFGSPDYDLLYRARNVHDAIFVAFPVNEGAESYFGWYRTAEEPAPFTPADPDVLAYAMRSQWFHRRANLHHGLLIARAPLTPMERRIVSLLPTERGEKEIAAALSLTRATTHTYVTTVFRKFGVSGRSGLAVLWLGT